MSTSRSLLTCLLLCVAGAACSKDKPAPVVAVAAPADASAAAAPPSEPPPDEAAVGEAPPAAEVDPVSGKSDELRFIEANAKLLCEERQTRKEPNAKQRAAVLRDHGFEGKAGAQRFKALSLRGDRDRDWGKRITERIQTEMEAICPLE